MRVGDALVMSRALAATGAIVVALSLAALIAGRQGGAPFSGPPAAAEPLRRDDLLFIAIAIVPGAVIGGRLAHGLTFFEHYSADPLGLLDPARGSLSLIGAVLGGALTGAVIASMLDQTPRRWAGVASVPLLVAISLGKLAQFAGGGGQGLGFDGPWAVAFTGPGPWQSPAAGVPAHPAQLYEAAWSLAGVPVLLAIARLRPPVRGMPLLLLAIEWWLVGRFVVAFTWRDDRVFGLLNAEQLLAALAFAAVLAIAPGATRAARRYRDTRLHESAADWGGASRGPE